MLAIIKKKTDTLGILRSVEHFIPVLLHKLRLRAATSWDRGGGGGKKCWRLIFFWNKSRVLSGIWF